MAENQFNMADTLVMLYRTITRHPDFTNAASTLNTKAIQVNGAS